MSNSSDTVQADFDRIALLPEPAWDHNGHYHNFLLRQLHPGKRALDMGCGTGVFSRRLAERFESVLGLDLSPQMIQLARERSRTCPNLEFRVADVLAEALPDAHFDAIVSIATLHHLPLPEILPRLARALKPRGVLAVLDLFETTTLGELLTGAFAMPASALLGLLRNGRLKKSSAAARAAWEQHGQHERYLTIAQVRETCRELLPGARVRHHLFWRYSLIWTKPG
ncbi:MAG: class I SAM-dependent methyltransferase [Anaerolineae bacterium]|jgi:ubiquinone/menaquinone biosynthesis C-methylase UbiE|nr:class I SAM-dependent methyltransferase [Anaerolineae bacterium]